MAQRALVSRLTLYKLERGDPAVGMGTCATVLFILGMSERLAVATDIRCTGDVFISEAPTQAHPQQCVAVRVPLMILIAILLLQDWEPCPRLARDTQIQKCQFRYNIKSNNNPKFA